MSVQATAFAADDSGEGGEVAQSQSEPEPEFEQAPAEDDPEEQSEE